MKKILILSDLHVGSLWGLWPPGLKLKDIRSGDDVEFVQNKTQKNLWKHWQKLITLLKDDPVDCILILGDVNDGMQKKGYGRGLVTPNMTWQVEAATHILKMLPKVPTYMVEGTEYHETADGTPVEQAIAEAIGAEFGDELVVEECGIRIFCRHVIGMSNSTWQYMTTAPARDHMLLYLNKAEDKYGQIDVAAFGHRHSFVAAEFLSGIALVCPCWQTKTPYAVKKGIVAPPDIGWLILNVHHKKCIAIDKSGITHLQKPCRVVGREMKR